MTTLANAAESPPAFDPFAPASLADPKPAFARFRQEQPVSYSPELDYWVLARLADVRAAFRDASTYSAANALSPIQPRSPRAAEILRDGYRTVPALSNTDPPVHTRNARRTASSGTLELSSRDHDRR